MAWNGLEVTFNQYVYIEFNNLIFRNSICRVNNIVHTHQIFFIFHKLVSSSRTLNGLVKLLRNKKMLIFCLTISKKYPQTSLTVANKYKILLKTKSDHAIPFLKTIQSLPSPVKAGLQHHLQGFSRSVFLSPLSSFHSTSTTHCSSSHQDCAHLRALHILFLLPRMLFPEGQASSLTSLRYLLRCHLISSQGPC